jgi:catechol 2,3-dioxygenase-like lactoylglutathione lyase family enzyme
VSKLPPPSVNHVGVTVPDIESATKFFVDALGGEVIYESVRTDDSSVGGAEAQKMHDLPLASQAVVRRMIKIGTGPDIELTEIHTPQPIARVPSDLGVKQISFYVEDIERAVERFRKAGGSVLSRRSQIDLTTNEESEYSDVQTPWGTNIRFATSRPNRPLS